MSYYPEPYINHIADKVKVLLDLSNYATTGIDTSDLAAKKDFIVLKAEVEKLVNINQLMFQLL